jgi:putative spermidine/putrescine transport system ATP-binding protein/spermidine/putrescine transport system ATP-binding protein
VDAKVRQEMRLEIRRVQQATGISAIYVTHDQSEALAMSDRIVVMNHGSIEQIGPPEEIYLRPESAFVADFMGSNVLEGKLSTVGGRVSVAVSSLDMSIEVDAAGAIAGDVQVAAHTEDVRVVPARTPGAGRARALVSSFLGDRVEVELQCKDGRRLIGILDGVARPAYDSEVGVMLDAARLCVIPVPNPRSP